MKSLQSESDDTESSNLANLDVLWDQSFCQSLTRPFGPACQDNICQNRAERCKVVDLYGNFCIKPAMAEMFKTKQFRRHIELFSHHFYKHFYPSK